MQHGPCVYASTVYMEGPNTEGVHGMQLYISTRVEAFVLPCAIDCAA